MTEPVFLPETAGSAYPTPRQIENGDAQAGGPDGLWNEHARVMIERTNWLSAALSALQNGGGYKSVATFAGNQTLTAADAGKCLIYEGAAAVTLTLPLISAAPVGSIFEFINTGTANMTVQRAGSDQIDSGPSAVTSIAIPPNQSLKLIRATGSSLWHPVSVTAAGLATSFGSSLTPNGWQRLPSGLIMQWGAGVVAGNGLLTVTFPIQWPTAGMFGAHVTSGQNTDIPYAYSSMSLTQMTIPFYKSTTGGGSSGGFIALWYAYGR